MLTRRLKRRHLLFYLPVCREDTGEKIGNVADITVEGMLVVGGEAIPSGHELELRIDLPEPVQGRTSVRFAARSVWSSRDANPSLFDTGFCFVRVPAEDALTIRRLIERFAFGD